MKRRILLLGMAGMLAVGCASPAPRTAHADLVEAVVAAERAFARTMAERDHQGFLGFVSTEAVFIDGDKSLVGREAIGRHWKRFYEGPAAPFSWRPDLVVVLASGTLAESIGPVSNPSGKVVARFRSVWRLESDGRWRVIFDNGYAICDCQAK